MGVLVCVYTYSRPTQYEYVLGPVYMYEHVGWRLGVVVSVVGRINEVNQHRARLVHDG